MRLRLQFLTLCMFTKVTYQLHVYQFIFMFYFAQFKK